VNRKYARVQGSFIVGWIFAGGDEIRAACRAPGDRLAAYEFSQFASIDLPTPQGMKNSRDAAGEES